VCAKKSAASRCDIFNLVKYTKTLTLRNWHTEKIASFFFSDRVFANFSRRARTQSASIRRRDHSRLQVKAPRRSRQPRSDDGVDAALPTRSTSKRARTYGPYAKRAGFGAALKRTLPSRRTRQRGSHAHAVQRSASVRARHAPISSRYRNEHALRAQNKKPGAWPGSRLLQQFRKTHFRFSAIPVRHAVTRVAAK